MSSNSPRPNTSKPLGLKVAKGPGAPKQANQVTNNSDGWAAVANIPVPPSSESRDFKKPLGLSPVLVNVAKAPAQTDPETSIEPAVRQEPAKTEHPKKDLGGQPAPQGLSFTPQTAAVKVVELDWYGAKLVLNCLNVIYQPANLARGGQKWLMLEMPLDPQTSRPPWTPPVAELQQDGRISVPEFKCIVEGEELLCQILNIELYDRVQKKYVVVFRVLN
jgi:hypothetical protein